MYLYLKMFRYLYSKTRSKNTERIFLLDSVKRLWKAMF